MNPTFNYIIEEAYVPTDAPKIIKDEKIGNDKYKFIFKTVLQQANVKNKNGRIYTVDVLKEVVEKLAPKAKNRELLSELDHPFLETSDQNVLKRRITQVRLSNVCCLIRDIKLDNDYIIAECETLTNSRGMDLYALIKDNVNIGFSLRAIGPLKPTPDGRIMVLPGIRPITYDVVSNPSHFNARIMEFLTEDVNNLYLSIDNDVILENELPVSALINIPTFGAIVKDTDDIPEEIKANIETASIKIDLPNNEVIICKNDTCTKTTIVDLIRNIIDLYTKDDKKKISPFAGVLCPVRYRRFLSLSLPTDISDIIPQYTTNIIPDDIEENVSGECQECYPELPLTIEEAEFFASLDESVYDKLLTSLLTETELYFEILDEIEDELLESIELTEEDLSIKEEDLFVESFEILDSDVSIEEYIDYLLETYESVENSKQIFKNEFEVVLEELNNIPITIEDLMLLEDYNQIDLDFSSIAEQIDENKLDYLLEELMDEDYNEFVSLIKESVNDEEELELLYILERQMLQNNCCIDKVLQEMNIPVNKCNCKV